MSNNFLAGICIVGAIVSVIYNHDSWWWWLIIAWAFSE